MTAVAKPSKLAPLLEKLFANPSTAWSMLPSGAEIKCKGIEGEREILVRRVGSRPGDVELKTFAKHAGFDDWHVFWLANQVAWLIEVCPDGLFDADEWLEASGKAHLVVRDEVQPSGTRASPVKSFVQQALAKPVLPDPEDAADYLESVQAAEEVPVTATQLDAVLEPGPLRPIRIAAKMPLRELGTRAGIFFYRITEIECDPPEGLPISSEERAAYLSAVESWATDQSAHTAPIEPTIVQEPPKPAPVFGMPEAFVLERERLTDGLMRHCEHLNDEQQKLRLEHLNSLNLEKLRIEFAEYASGSAARALGLKKLPDWDQLPGGTP